MSFNRDFKPNYVDFHIINKLNEILPHFSIKWENAKVNQLITLYLSFSSNLYVINPNTKKIELIHPSYFESKNFRKLRKFVLSLN